MKFSVIVVITEHQIVILNCSGVGWELKRAKQGTEENTVEMPEFWFASHCAILTLAV